ncbi:MAG: putative lipoprotein [Myxococcaceae bacterium]|nr:putative lipoprotein [Myxococcaceae bacterium]
MARLGPLRASIFVIAATACVDDVDGLYDLDAGPVTVSSADAAVGFTLPAHCLEEDQNVQRAPSTLECTGLYRSVADKVLGDGIRSFTPAYALWSDNAEKHRWVLLPEGTTVDTTNQDAWSFPVGTRTWKEFRHAGRRVETRFFRKVSKFTWLTATYLWSADEASAYNFEGGDVPVADGSSYHVPTQMECEQCHRGASDQLLGFQSVLLGLPSADGLTLAGLVAEGRLSTPPRETTHRIPDDGTGLAAPALGWLHVNCGVSCHNELPDAEGGPSRMFLRINPSTLQAQTPASWNSLTTTLDVPAHIANFLGRKRIIPGDPAGSLLVELASSRGTSKQMPPLATKVVDQSGLQAVRAWIAALGPKSTMLDAGSALGDAGVEPADAGTDGAEPLPLDRDAAIDLTDLDASAADGEALVEPVPVPDLDAGLTP